ncbi:hypothetical protein ANCDUO_02456 [Ancylostoma duodenale]|uniref:Uncharacterized protein n=1 Tax=Ancylostoma duodenale TaxID=51022 RepID=A0A0C2HCD9_9BILA|nr:hypothetical protein ANCDUO_02456 [Ancylostoma duodenale]
MCMNSLKELIPDKSRDLDEQEKSAAVAKLKPLAESLEVHIFPLKDELNKAADEIRERQLRDKKALLEQMDGDLSQYAINVDTKTLAKASDVKMIYSRPLGTGKRWKKEAKGDGGPLKKKKLFKKKKMI